MLASAFVLADGVDQAAADPVLSLAAEVPADSRVTLPVEGVPGRRVLLQFWPFLDPARAGRARTGLALFNTDFEPYLPQAPRRSGLGPLYNSRSCEGCHNNLGRGRMSDRSDRVPPALVVQLSSVDATGRVIGGDPTYGVNLNPAGVAGVPAEAVVEVAWVMLPGTYPDGERYELRRPDIRFRELAYGPLGRQTVTSARLAPPIIGVGLLEAIPEAVIVGAADPSDRDGDGVLGWPNWVTDAAGRRRLGRFGWKANQPDVLAQTAAAAHAEMGLTNGLHPEPNCTTTQRECLAAATRTRQPELVDADLEAIVEFQQSVAVPRRRPLGTAGAAQGAGLFAQIGCAACHRPELAVGDVPGLPLLSGARIQPFSDLLLHDMGEDLADGRPDHEASGRDWRTPPLWGLGLWPAGGSLLHDGRARSAEEAILWHGGEGAAARRAFVGLTRDQRAALLAFLDTL